MHTSNLLSPELQSELIAFAQSLVRIKSLSGQEGEIIQFIKEKMAALGFDEIRIDAMGNLLGRIGDGATKSCSTPTLIPWTSKDRGGVDHPAVQRQRLWAGGSTAGGRWI